MSAEEIIKLFELPLMTVERIQRALDKLQADRNVIWNEDGSLQRLLCRRSTMALTIPIQKQRTLRRYRAPSGICGKFSSLHRKAPISFYLSLALIAIPRGQFMPVAMKIIELRNWILEYSRQYLEESDNSETGSYLMQLDMNLFPVKKRP